MMGAQLVKVMQYKVCACMKLPDTHSFGMHVNLKRLAKCYVILPYIWEHCKLYGVMLFLKMYNYKIYDHSKIKDTRQPMTFCNLLFISFFFNKLCWSWAAWIAYSYIYNHIPLLTQHEKIIFITFRAESFKTKKMAGIKVRQFAFLCKTIKLLIMDCLIV